MAAAGCAPPLDALATGERGRLEAAGDDGLRLGQLRVRLAGVALGPDVEASLQRWAVGRDATLLYGGPRNVSEGPAPAHVRLDDGHVWLQGRLIDQGLARVRTTADDRALAGEMLRREARARAAGRGGWAEPGWRVLTPAEVGRTRGFVLVEGRVRRVERRGRSLFLDFGTDLRDDLSVRVPAAALEEFAAAGVRMDDLAERLIRVRGVVRPSRYGPVMTIDHPEALEPLREP